MNEPGNKNKKSEHFIIIPSVTDAHLHVFVPLFMQLSLRIEYVSFIRSFIHSFLGDCASVIWLPPLHHPLFSPLGALNGSWRRCGTLCCFQEALLNAVCPVALSPLFPLLSIEMYCIFCSHHKVQHYVACLQKKIPELKMLYQRKYVIL